MTYFEVGSADTSLFSGRLASDRTRTNSPGHSNSVTRCKQAQLNCVISREVSTMSSDTTPATENTENTSSTSPSTPPQAPPARFLTGGCMCKSIRYKIARDECQERMSMSMYLPFHHLSLAQAIRLILVCPAEFADPDRCADVIAGRVKSLLPRHLVSVSSSLHNPSPFPIHRIY
jgi:hypothetical protein